MVNFKIFNLIIIELHWNSKMNAYTDYVGPITGKLIFNNL